MLKSIISKIKLSKKKHVSIINGTTTKPEKVTRVIVISDTHNRHDELDLPEANIIIHAGNFTIYGSDDDTTNFLKWFDNVPIKYKIIVMGDHEYRLRFKIKEMLIKFPSIILLNDEFIKIKKLKIYGNEGFNEMNIDSKHINILITHYPPLNILDRNKINYNCGLSHINDFTRGKHINVHIFGHIHEDHGVTKIKETTYINASIMANSLSRNSERLDLNDIIMFDII